MTTFDLAVVGAGPTGSAAALTAAACGLSTVVIDKAQFPRDKTCGDGLTANALRLLEQLGVHPDELRGPGGYAPVRKAVLVPPRGPVVELPLPERSGDYAAVVARRVLDAALVDRLRKADVELREGVAVGDVVQRADAVDLLLDDGEVLTARWVVAADGHWSSVRRAVEPDRAPDLGVWHAARQYFDQAGDGRLWVVFEPDLLPGYAWVFPLPNGRANVGFGVLRAKGVKGRDLKALWPNLLARPSMQRILGPKASAEEQVRAWPIPASYDARRLTAGRVLFAGDAACVVDPMTGEGIAQGIESGMLAAHAIAGGADPAATYRRAVDRRLGRDLRFAARLQRLLATPTGASLAIRLAGVSPWTRRNFARWMFEDYPRAVLTTPDRWRRGMFDTRGAFAETPRGHTGAI